MWLIRLHLLKTKDYNKISRICKNAWLENNKYSFVLLVKWLCFHCLLNKPWRQISDLYKISYTTLYQFYNKTRSTDAFLKVFEYLCERKIILFIEDKKIINEQIMNSEETRVETLKKLRRICK